MNQTYIRIIGDIHNYLYFSGSQRSYFQLIGEAEYTVQIGDFGYPWKRMPDFHQEIANIDKTHHVVLLGNHDDYTTRVQHALGDFGTHSFPLKEGSFEFFYIRGARTPAFDRARRLPGISWWAEEELNWEQGHECVLAYEKAKPKIVLTHDCPEEILYLIGKDFRPSITNNILQSCFERHSPRFWIFGHHHFNWRYEYKGTTFICLDGHIPSIGHNMGYVDFDDMGHLVTPKPL